MVDHRRWLALPQSHLECLEHELGAEMAFHRPTYNAATPSVEDDGQIQESRPGPNVGDVGDPELIRPIALGLVWIFNSVGTIDLLNALRHVDVAPGFGAAWYIPTMLVPLLLVTHFMIFQRLLARNHAG